MSRLQFDIGAMYAHEYPVLGGFPPPRDRLQKYVDALVGVDLSKITNSYAIGSYRPTQGFPLLASRIASADMSVSGERGFQSR